MTGVKTTPPADHTRSQPEAGSLAPAEGLRRAQPPGLVWEWTAAVLGAVYALPGAVVVLGNRPRGLALAVGVLPAASVGLMPTRRGRLAIVVLGMSIGVPMFVGGLVAGVPVLAVVAIGALAAVGLVRLSPSAWVYSLAAIVAVAGATHRSRWYATPAFTTFLVFLLLLYALKTGHRASTNGSWKRCSA